jgi:hypothetical protein
MFGIWPFIALFAAARAILSQSAMFLLLYMV